jgi:hypothetical protein
MERAAASVLRAFFLKRCSQLFNGSRKLYIVAGIYGGAVYQFGRFIGFGLR